MKKSLQKLQEKVSEVGKLTLTELKNQNRGLVTKLTSQKRKAYLNNRGNQILENRQEYIATKNRTNASIRELKREYWAKFTRDLYGNRRQVWKLTKARKKIISEYTTVNKMNPERWMSYIAKLYCLQDISLKTDQLENSNSRLMTEDIDDYGKQIEITKNHNSYLQKRRQR